MGKSTPRPGRVRASFTVDKGRYVDLLRSMDEAGVPRYTLGTLLDDLFKGLEFQFKTVARAKREGRQLSFGDMIGAHLTEVINQVDISKGVKDGKED